MIGKFIVFTVLWHPLCYMFDLMFSDHDISSDLLDSVSPYLRHTIRYDSFYLIEIMDAGYRWDINHAFLPGIYFVGWVSKLICGSYYLYFVLLLGKVCNFLSMHLIHKITMVVYQDRKQADLVSTLFLFSPASCFFNSFYTESYFTTCIFYATYLSLKKKPVQSAIWFAVATLFRSNGLFYIIVTGYPILGLFISNLRKFKIKDAILHNMPTGIIIGLIHLLPYALVLYYPYTIYCDQSPQQPSYCYDRIPNIYSYIQDHYWKVGLFRSIKQLGPKHYYGLSGIYITSRWVVNWLKCPNPQLTPLVLQQLIFLFIITLIAYIQCSTRFLSTSVIFYWALADFTKTQTNFALFFIIQFNLCGIILFTNYLPFY